MVKCSYCSSDLKKGTGLMYVYKTGELAYYCSNSCFKNHVMLRRKINRKLVATEQKVVKATGKK